MGNVLKKEMKNYGHFNDDRNYGGDVFMGEEETMDIEMTIVTFWGDVFGRGEKTMAIEMTIVTFGGDVFGRGEKTMSNLITIVIIGTMFL